VVAINIREVDGELLKRLKVRAAEEGKTLKEIVVEYLEQGLAVTAVDRPGRSRTRFPGFPEDPTKQGLISSRSFPEGSQFESGSQAEPDIQAASDTGHEVGCSCNRCSWIRAEKK
jgi:hypothetical protein